MNSLKGKLVNVCILVTLTLTLLVALETSARILKWIKYMPVETGQLEPEEVILLKFDWGKQTMLDAAGDMARYMTYVEFREKPYVSQTLNIDKESRRFVPGNCENPAAFTIMTFGGSTMFGAMVPDQFTIPAYLAKLLNQEGHCVKLVNYGSSWWQSSQSLIQLIEVLKHGVRPHMVIFYDGINEINALAFGGKPGGIDPGAEDMLQQLFEPPPEQNDLNQFANSFLIVRVPRRLLRPSRQKNEDNEYAVPEDKRSEYANALVDVYATNVRSVTGLAKEYGFSTYFFLQPSPLIAKKKNTDLELAAFRVRAAKREWEADFFRLAYEKYKHHAYLISHPRFFDISGIFDGLTAELYLDSEHLLPEGNRIVAERIAKEILPELESLVRTKG